MCCVFSGEGGQEKDANASVYLSTYQPARDRALCCCLGRMGLHSAFIRSNCHLFSFFSFLVLLSLSLPKSSGRQTSSMYNWLSKHRSSARRGLRLCVGCGGRIKAPEPARVRRTPSRVTDGGSSTTIIFSSFCVSGTPPSEQSGRCCACGGRQVFGRVGLSSRGLSLVQETLADNKEGRAYRRSPWMATN